MPLDFTVPATIVPAITSKKVVVTSIHFELPPKPSETRQATVSYTTVALDVNGDPISGSSKVIVEPVAALDTATLKALELRAYVQAPSGGKVS